MPLSTASDQAIALDFKLLHKIKSKLFRPNDSKLSATSNSHLNLDSQIVRSHAFTDGCVIQLSINMKFSIFVKW